MASHHRPLALLVLFAAGCGARSHLGWDDEGSTSAVGGGGATSTSTQKSSSSSTGGEGGSGGSPACLPGETQPCGSDVGECQPGLRVCEDGFLGPCKGAIGPFDELCNDLDDDCDGQTDEDFGLGQSCDGPDGDVCADDVVICGGCTQGPTNQETCNGFDDNCNGVIDADCDVGKCMPSLLVTGSTPSSPGCVDFEIEKGSTGTIDFPCTGGPVSANLGGVLMSGSVTNGFVNLTGTSTFPDPNGCTWQADHKITGNVTSGALTYTYAEHVLVKPPGIMCYLPCTETGSVTVQY